MRVSSIAMATASIIGFVSAASNVTLPDRIADYVFKACSSSAQNYPTFSLQSSSDDMTLEMCVAGCSGRQYAGIYSTDCYCADAYESALAVTRDLCSSVPCPGNPDEGCGGVATNSTSNSTTAFLHRRDTGIKRRQAATGPVPADALLAVYEYSPLATPSTATATATAVVTATATATGCFSGFCTGAGYIFEQCQGFPNAGELVFVIEACSCAGGFKYVPAGCDGSACGSLVVYRPLPCPAGATNVTVYQPQACTSCSAGVSFEQGTGTAVVTGSVPANTTAVVVAGASKVVGYLSSAMVAAGALALLL